MISATQDPTAFSFRETVACTPWNHSSCIDRATKLVKQILSFSRKDQETKQRELVEITSIITEVFEMLQPSLPPTVKFSREISTEESNILADPTQIHQVLVNLCTNAAYAMREKGGLPEVSLEDINLDSETLVGDENLILQRHFRVLHRKTCDNARKTMVRRSHMAKMAL